MKCTKDNCIWAKDTHICFWRKCPYSLESRSPQEEQGEQETEQSGESTDG